LCYTDGMILNNSVISPIHIELASIEPDEDTQTYTIKVYLHSGRVMTLRNFTQKEGDAILNQIDKELDRLQKRPRIFNRL